MIVIRVELWSVITGEKTELARMHISNTGNGSAKRGDYAGETFVGRSTAALDRKQISKEAEILNYPRNDLHVWNLVARMLKAMGYDR